MTEDSVMEVEVGIRLVMVNIVRSDQLNVCKVEKRDQWLVWMDVYRVP